MLLQSRTTVTAGSRVLDLRRVVAGVTAGSGVLDLVPGADCLYFLEIDGVGDVAEGRPVAVISSSSSSDDPTPVGPCMVTSNFCRCKARTRSATSERNLTLFLPELLLGCLFSSGQKLFRGHVTRQKWTLAILLRWLASLASQLFLLFHQWHN